MMGGVDTTDEGPDLEADMATVTSDEWHVAHERVAADVILDADPGRAPELAAQFAYSTSPTDPTTTFVAIRYPDGWISGDPEWSDP